MNCEQVRGQIEMYLDNELPSDAIQAIEGHVGTCRECSGLILKNVQWRRQVRAAGKAHVPHASFRRRIYDEVERKQHRSWRWDWALIAATAVVVTAGTLVFTIHRQERLTAQQTFSEVADLHVGTLASESPVDVVSTDRHTVKPWFEGKIPFTFNLPELSGSDFSLVGGRVAYLHQAPGAELIFQIRKHRISVFIFQERAMADGLPATAENSPQLTFNVNTWTQDGLRYFIVGDAGNDDLAALSRLLKAAGHS